MHIMQTLYIQEEDIANNEQHHHNKSSQQPCSVATTRRSGTQCVPKFVAVSKFDALNFNFDNNFTAVNNS